MADSNSSKMPLAISALLLAGCGSSVAIVGQHVSNPLLGPVYATDDTCEVTTDYLGIGRGRSWQHESGATRVYATVGIKDTRQCSTMDPDFRDISPGAQLLVIREFYKAR